MRAACFVLCFALLLTACAGPRLTSAPFVYGNASDDGAPVAAHPPVEVASTTGTGPVGDGEGLDQRYEVGPRRLVGGPTDVNVDLATSFPRRGSLLPQVIPQRFFDWKKRLYKRTGVMVSGSYQALVQRLSDTLPLPSAALGSDSNTVAGGHALLEVRWAPVCRGGEYEGSISAALDWRHTLFGKVTPTEGQFLGGSGWGTGALFWEWDPTILALFWQQWLGKDKFEFRVGKQAVPGIYDFFRFKDARVSYMADPLHADIVSVPAPPPGYGVSFKSWPFRSKRWKPLYVVGVLADMNGDPEEINPETFFKGQYFYGLEVGYNWKRQFPKDFDHAHVNVWYADERSEPYDTPGIFPNRPGWGFKLAGTKQWGKFCAFAKYTFNDAKGGGLGLTWAKNSASVGCVFLDPFCLSGELGLGLSWLDPHVNLLPGAFAMPRDQYGIDLYWKLLATPNLWVTPGVQFIFDPSLNPTTDHLTVLGFKVRWFF